MKIGLDLLNWKPRKWNYYRLNKKRLSLQVSQHFIFYHYHYTPAPPKVEWGYTGFTPMSVRPSVHLSIHSSVCRQGFQNFLKIFLAQFISFSWRTPTCVAHDCKIEIFIGYFWMRWVVIRVGVYCPHSLAQLVYLGGIFENMLFTIC